MVINMDRYWYSYINHHALPLFNFWWILIFFFLIKNYSLSITYFGQDLVCNNPFGVGQIPIYLWSNSSNWVEIFVIIMNYISWELFSTFFGLEGCSMFSYLNMFCWNSRTALHYWRCMRGAIMHGGHICLCSVLFTLFWTHVLSGSTIS